MSASGDRTRGPRERADRADRILTVASDLLLRFGYRRVTIDDVARQADIGKGTIYLHWKTRDELFRAVFEREVLGAIDELLAGLRRDRGTWRPHRFAARYFVAIMSRPLLRAFFLADAELLGKLVKPGSGDREKRHDLVSQSYFEVLAEHGVLRDDMSTEDLAYAFLATLEGFIQAAAEHDDIQARSELLAATVQRAFETGRKLSRATEDAIAARVIDLITHLSEADHVDD